MLHCHHLKVELQHLYALGTSAIQYETPKGVGMLPKLLHNLIKLFQAIPHGSVSGFHAGDQRLQTLVYNDAFHVRVCTASFAPKVKNSCTGQ